jgi:uncharacterized protein YbbC (DUF1343 family)
MLSGLDALVFGSLDIGIRYWTFTTTMTYCMEAAKEAGIEVIVVDYPNPIGGTIVEGCPMEAGQASFLCGYPVTLRHGMTVGELAMMFNKKYGISCELTVIRFEDWDREQWYDETGLLWTSPGPNIPTLDSVMGYAATGLLQSTNVSVGRGTTRSFELFGAPWTDGKDISEKINKLGIPGLFCIYKYFHPTFSKYTGETCSGVLLVVTDKKAFRPVTAAIHILSILAEDYPEHIKFDDEKFFDNRAGTSSLRKSLLEGRPAASILENWNLQAKQFDKDRQDYLLYW